MRQNERIQTRKKKKKVEKKQEGERQGGKKKITPDLQTGFVSSRVNL